MSDVLTSIIRDVTGKIVGAIAGLALAAGVTVPADMSAQLTVVVGGLLAVLCQIVYYVAVRWAEQRWPAAGRLLGAASAPNYGLTLPVHARMVIDHDATVTEALRLKEQAQQLVNDATRPAPPRPRM